MTELSSYIRTVPDFPKPGILFYDITTLLENPKGFQLALDRMEEYIRAKKPDAIVAIESRGFLFGAALADRLGLGVIPVRKIGKLPSDTISQEYALEYGTDHVEIHSDSIEPGDKVVIVDDLIATGGTIAATCKLVERLGGKVAGISAVIELSFLPWRATLKNYDVDFLITFDSE
ncbi:MAG: adenine phosphoribosyltransferase [Candidatus Zixiibacteriota bacterium]